MARPSSGTDCKEAFRNLLAASVPSDTLGHRIQPIRRFSRNLSLVNKRDLISQSLRWSNYSMNIGASRPIIEILKGIWTQLTIMMSNLTAIES
ncbi:hypothetical protein MMC32_006519 [Xylographa parallela]|nr:hypothetical protein [Xylographa parallela]